MAKLKILQYPDLRLRSKGLSVMDVKNSKIQQLIDDMLEIMLADKGCAGLAATQLDIQNPPQVAVINEDPVEKKVLCLINPVITHSEGKACDTEGCMSICSPYIRAEIVRPEKITLKALDRESKQLEITTGGDLARYIQHEIDHLNGILYIDHLSPLKRKMIDKKIAKIKRQQKV